ncbi:hypothetical protein H650_15440 [Enterobacter sp. R4-368]|nr:hypothetical protein H650_15440 [Enterobacter sp. R4-368]
MPTLPVEGVPAVIGNVLLYHWFFTEIDGASIEPMDVPPVANALEEINIKPDKASRIDFRFI